MRRKATPRSGGFTLIELLVVIVIVATLAGLLFSVLGSARETSKSAQCVSNLRQIFTALTLYTQDHDNTLPQRMYPNNENGDVNFGYTELILPYIDPGSTPENSALAKKLYTCPSQKEANYPDEPGYGMNWFYDNARLSAVSRPTQTILLAEDIRQ